MPLPELDNLVRINQLKAEPGTQSEFNNLLHSGTVRLNDAKKYSDMSPESRFDLAYNAAHALSLAALRWHGYRSENRYLVFQCLIHTIGLPSDQWRILDQAHKKRNLAEYEGHIDVEESLLMALITVTDEVIKGVSKLGVVAA
ncbi:MAG: hypothetical protein V4525_08200 [Pseudomonadota bacterium]